MSDIATLHRITGTLEAVAADTKSEAVGCKSAESLEMFLDVTDGSGTVAADLETAPTKDGPWLVAAQISAKNAAAATAHVGIIRGAGVGMFFRTSRTIATDTATYTLDVVSRG